MELSGNRILIFAADTFEDLELHYPKIRLKEAGAEVLVAGPASKTVYTGKHGVPVKSDLGFNEVNVDQFQALIIPGGYAPDKLRGDKKVLEITKKFYDQGKLIAFICHAGWVPISAKVINGVRCTSVNAIKDDLINAGANWVDEPVVVDQNFISSRDPNDLPQFCPAIIKFLQKNKKSQYALT